MVYAPGACLITALAAETIICAVIAGLSMLISKLKR